LGNGPAGDLGTIVYNGDPENDNGKDWVPKKAKHAGTGANTYAVPGESVVIPVPPLVHLIRLVPCRYINVMQGIATFYPQNKTKPSSKGFQSNTAFIFTYAGESPTSAALQCTKALTAAGINYVKDPKAQSMFDFMEPDWTVKLLLFHLTEANK